MTQMCLCGARFQAATVDEVWALMDTHYAAKHQRRPPIPGGTVEHVHAFGRRRARRAPHTHQGGDQ